MKKFFSSICVGAAAFALALPADATLNPVVSTASGQIVGGSPGANRAVHGTITLGASDTYVTGGFTLTPQQFGFNNTVTYIQLGSPNGVTVANGTLGSGLVTVKLTSEVTGTSNVTASSTTKLVTLPAGVTITANTPILCSLEDSATAGGGTGTWSVTNTVSTCDETSTSSFTLTAVAAAPTGGGNFVWALPTISAELTAGTPVASYVIPFVAVGI